MSDTQPVTQASPLQGFQLSRTLAVIGGMRSDMVDDFPGERRDFLQMALILFTTAAEACVAGGFAIYLAFKDWENPDNHLAWWIVMLFAVGWALVIFTIDRYMVLGMEGMHGIRAFASFLIRLCLAVVIGVVMSTPLILQIFSPDIQREIPNILFGEQASLEKEGEGLQGQVEQAKQELETAQQQVAELEAKLIPLGANDPAYQAAVADWQNQIDECSRLTTQADMELNGTGGTGVPGRGGAYYDKRNLADAACAQVSEKEAAKAAALAKANTVTNAADIEHDLAAAQLTRDRAQTMLDSLNEQLQTKTDDIARAKSYKMTGLLTQLRALNTVAGWEHQEAFWGRWSIAGLLMAIEILPVLFKFLKQTKRGVSAYEQACTAKDQSVVRRLTCWETDAVTAYEHLSSVQVASADNMRDLQVRLQKEMNRKIVEVQRGLMGQALAKWEQDHRTALITSGAGELSPGWDQARPELTADRAAEWPEPA